MGVDFINIPWDVLLLQGMPEQIAVVTLAYAIAKLPLKWKEIIPMGILLAVLAYGVRLLPFPFGMHSLILILILFIFLILRGKVDVSMSLITSLLSFLALMIFEVICVSILMAVFKVSREIWFNNQVLRILFGEPQTVLLFITAFLIRRKRRVMHD